MPVTIALLGDTMLAGGVAERLADRGPHDLVAPEIIELLDTADLRLLNLECCLSDRGERWPAPLKPFFFRAPPAAVELLSRLGIDCVTLANNHSLDYGRMALADTFAHLADAGIHAVGAGPNIGAAQAGAVLTSDQLSIGVLGFTDHPVDFAATGEDSGVAYADLTDGAPQWLRHRIDDLRVRADLVLVTPHWGPNKTPRPLPYVQAAAEQLISWGADLIAGHSAHVFHPVAGPVLYDLGDFLDDYAPDRALRNDLGLLFLVTLDTDGPVRTEAVPIAIDRCRTRLADPDEAAWISRRFRHLCRTHGNEVGGNDQRLIIEHPSVPAGRADRAD